MSRHTEPQAQDLHQEASAAYDWLLVADFLRGPIPRKNVRSASEVDASDMEGLLGSVKLQCTELAGAQRVVERAIQSQTDEIRSQQSRSSRVTDGLAMSLDEHTLDMQTRLAERTLAECESLGQALRQELADDIRNLPDEKEKVAQKLDEDTRQRKHELQTWETNMQQFKDVQKTGFQRVNERAQRLEEGIEALEKRSDESCSTQ